MGPHDQHIVIGDGPQPDAASWMPARDERFNYYEHGPTHDFGNSQRDFAIQMARGDFLMFIDDDDAIIPGVLASDIRPALARAPHDCHVFRMRGHPCRRSLMLGDLGGSMLICPNVPSKLGRWTLGHIASTQPTPAMAKLERDMYNYIRDYTFIRATLSCYDFRPIFHDTEMYIVDPANLKARNAAPITP